MVSGMRQVGKSTLLEHLASKQRQYVTLDNSRQLLSATESPETFFRLNPAPRTIDEIQLAPQLFRSLKKLSINQICSVSIGLVARNDFH